MKSYKNIIAAIMFSLATSLPIYAFDIALGNEEKSLGIKITHDADEPFGKPLPWGPASVRFSGNSLWAADTLKNRIVEYDTKGTFVRAIPLKIPSESTIGDFCFGMYKDQKVLYVCDEDNPVIYIFNSSGKPLAKIGSIEKRSILLRPSRIEFYNNKIYVLDTGRSNIFVFNTDLNQEKAIVTFGNNFTIENDFLVHKIKLGKKNGLDFKNLKTGDTKSIYFKNLETDENTDIDYLFCNNGLVCMGTVKFVEGANKAQYQIIQVDKDEKLSIVNTDYPVSFMPRSFIKDQQGKPYQIKFDESKPDKLTIDKLPDNFKDSEG